MRRRELAIELGRLVAEARTERGLSQQVLAGIVGLSQQAVARIELGHRAVSFVEGLELAEALGLEPIGLDPRQAGESQGGPSDHLPETPA